MIHGETKVRRRDIFDRYGYDQPYSRRDGCYVWDPHISFQDYIWSFYASFKGRETGAFRPSKPRWKK